MADLLERRIFHKASGLEDDLDDPILLSLPEINAIVKKSEESPVESERLQLCMTWVDLHLAEYLCGDDGIDEKRRKLDVPA
jgi:hypothetical protein